MLTLIIMLLGLSIKRLSSAKFSTSSSQQARTLMHAKLRDPVYHVMHFGVGHLAHGQPHQGTSPHWFPFLDGTGIGNYKVNLGKYR